VQFRDRVSGVERIVEGLTLPMPGRHNVQNSLAVAVIARDMGFDDEVLRRGLANFSGVKRRFTRTGEVRGITVIDDYGHHPVEIAAVLAAARGAYSGRVIAVVQPHRYSRLKHLFLEFCTCFNDADIVIVADVYAAGEVPLEGADRDHLITGLRSHGHREVLGLDGPEQLAPLVDQIARTGDLVVCLGAGNITTWANALPAELEALHAAEAPGTGRQP